MGFLWIVTFSLSAVLISASHGPAVIPAGYAPDIARSILEPKAITALALVLLFYYFRFSEWPADTAADLRQRAPRHFTTSSRYHLAAAIYASMMGALFLGIYLFPEAIAQGVDAFSRSLNDAQGFGQSVTTGYASVQIVGGPAAPQAAAAGIPVPQLGQFLKQLANFLEQGSRSQNWVFTVVALMIVVWPKLPMSRDEAIRGALQRFAAIPTEARGLMRRLRWNHAEFQPATVATYRLLRGTDLLELGDFRALPENDAMGWESEPLTELAPYTAHARTTENPHRIGFQFAKLLYLTRRLVENGEPMGRWSSASARSVTNEELARAVEEIAAMLRDLRLEAVAVARKAEDAFEQRFADGVDPGKLPLQRLLDFVDANVADGLPEMRGLSQLRQEAKRRIREALDRVYFHLVTSILASEPSEERQRERFAQFGFHLAPAAAPLQESNALGTLIALILIAALLPTGLYGGVTQLAGLDNSALDMQCGSLVLTKTWQPAVWSVIAVAQNVLAVIIAFVLYAVLDRHEPARATRCASEPKPLTFEIFTRRVVAFLNAASLAFFVNLLLLAVLTGLDPGGTCRIGHTWTWAILPGIAAGFTAVYLRMSTRGFRAYQWPLWQSFLTGMAAVLIALFVLDDQSGAGNDGIDLDWWFLVLAPLGFFVGLNSRLHCLDPDKRRWGVVRAFGVLALLGVLYALAWLAWWPGSAEFLSVLRWAPETLLDGADWLVLPVALLLGWVSGRLLALGYRILLLWRTPAGSWEQAKEEHCDGPAQPQARPLLVGILAIMASVLYGGVIYLVALWSFDLLGDDPLSRTRHAELSFLLYAYTSASTVALLSGFFVIKFRESGAVCGKGMEPFMNDESFEVVLETASGKTGGLGVVPISASRAMVISVPARYPLQDAHVQLPNGERSKAAFKRSSPRKSDSKGETHRTASAKTPTEPSRIWMELVPT